MSSSNAVRVIAVGRYVLPWLVGPAVMVMRGRFLELAGPGACPGLLEFVSIAAVRLGSNLSIGAVFDLLYAIALIVGLAVFVELVFRRTRNMAVAASTGVAAGVSPLFGLTLSPPWEAAAFGMCAAAALFTCVLLDRRTRTSWALVIVGLGILLAAALLLPPWLIVAVAAAFVTVATAVPRLGRVGRLMAGSAAALGLALLALIVLNLSRPDALAGPSSWHTLAACTLPMPSPKRAMGFASTVVWLFGPFALALAVLGLFVEASRVAWRRAVLTASIVIVCVVLAAGTAMSPHVALTPLAVGLWWLAGSGLREMIPAMSTKPIVRVTRHLLKPQSLRMKQVFALEAVLAAAQRPPSNEDSHTDRSSSLGGLRRSFVTVLVLLLLPALEASRRGAEERDDWVRPRGHETQTLRQMTGMLNLVSPGASFVEEDSTVDALMRAAIVGGRRTSKPFTVVARSSDIVRHALGGGPVYAFPHAQEDLSLRGFAIEPLKTIEGVGEITATRPCQVIGDRWADLPGVSGRIAMSADSETVRGPVVMYLGGSTAAEPRPDGWPPRTTRGFHFFTFDQSGGRSDRLVAEARDAGLATDHAALAEPFVIRLTLHRTPLAPLGLAVVLGAAFPRGVAKLERAGAEAGHFTICEAPAIHITPLG